jgi:hypothetical protein
MLGRATIVCGLSYVLLLGSSSAQEKLALTASCNFAGDGGQRVVFTFDPDPETKEAVAKLVERTGLARNFVLLAANVPNATAAVDSDKRRVILYNQDFMTRLTESNSDWAAKAILAHELGHHLQGHLFEQIDRMKSELEADKYSGFLLGQLGAKLNEAQSAVESLGSDDISGDYPPKSARLAAVTNGWKTAHGAVEASKVLKVDEPPAKEKVKQDKAVDAVTRIDEHREGDSGSSAPANPVKLSFVSRCVFNGDPNAYYVTNLNDIVASMPNGQVTLVGRRIPPTVPGFAWTYQNAYGSYGVTPQGLIMAAYPNGLLYQIGYITRP